MFYGVLQEEYLYEFDLKGTFEAIKKKVINAIIAFIEKVEGFLNKGKDNKVKQVLRSILSKAKDLLKKAKETKEEKEARKHAEYLNKLKEEFNKVTEYEAAGGVEASMITSWVREKKKLLDDPSKYRAVVAYKCNEDKLSKIDKEAFDVLDVNDDFMCVFIYEKDKPSNIKFKKNIAIEDSIESNLQAKLIENDGWIDLAL
jgi:methionyl-tRNA synthetase